LIFLSITHYAKEHSETDKVRLLNAAKIISKAMPLSISIDNYIEAQREDKDIARCGKLAIVRAIREAEKNCELTSVYCKTQSRSSRVKNIEDIENLWYLQLFQKITEGCDILCFFTTNIKKYKCCCC
jgi:hypothetical protein